MQELLAPAARIGARLKARGAGVVVSRHRLNPPRLRAAIRRVLEECQYREAARRLQRVIQQIDGPGRAADIIEQVLKLRATESYANPQA